MPVNWHFKPEEVDYILEDSGTRVADRPCRHAASAWRAISAGVTVLSVPTPPEILANYRIDPRSSRAARMRHRLETWLAEQAPYDGPALPQPQNMIYTSGTTGHPKGVRRTAPTPEQTAHRSACAR